MQQSDETTPQYTNDRLRDQTPIEDNNEEEESEEEEDDQGMLQVIPLGSN